MLGPGMGTPVQLIGDTECGSSRVGTVGRYYIQWGQLAGDTWNQGPDWLHKSITTKRNMEPGRQWQHGSFLIGGTPFSRGIFWIRDRGTKSLGTERLWKKRLRDKMSTGQKVYRNKSSIGTKCLRDKSSKGQMSIGTKHLMGQNV